MLQLFNGEVKLTIYTSTRQLYWLLCLSLDNVVSYFHVRCAILCRLGLDPFY